MNPDGERDYYGHPKPDNFWPMAVTISVLAICTTICCLGGFYIWAH